MIVQREIQDSNSEDEHQVPSTTKRYITGQTQTPSSTTGRYDITTQRIETSTPSIHGHETTERENGSDVPSLCRDGFDTITFFRNELFVFKDKVLRRSVFGFSDFTERNFDFIARTYFVYSICGDSRKKVLLNIFTRC